MLRSSLNSDALKEAFSTVIGNPDEGDWSSVQYGSTSAWDSMAHMQLVSEIEVRFNIMLSTDQVIALSSFEKAREIVESHGIIFEP